MIADMEYHIRDMILAHVPAGWDSLGVHVEFNHTAATMVGEEVDVFSTITAVERKLVKAETIISDRMGELGRGVHHRVVADVARNQSALDSRAASLAALPQPPPTVFVRGPPHHGSRTPAEYLEDLSARTSTMQLGDSPPLFDQYCRGEWIQGFEQEVAALMGKARGLFVVTGTQAQQCALQAHAEGAASRQKLFAAHPTSHLLVSEEDAYKHLSGFEAIEIGDAAAPLSAAAAKNAFARMERLPSVLIVEIPQRHNGGATICYSELVELRAVCDEYGVRLHMDGARLWEAQPAFRRSFAEICALFDSVYLSFYKGIGAAVGAMLCGTDDFVERAAVWRVRYGGRMVSTTTSASSDWPRLQFSVWFRSVRCSSWSSLLMSTCLPVVWCGGQLLATWPPRCVNACKEARSKRASTSCARLRRAWWASQIRACASIRRCHSQP